MRVNSVASAHLRLDCQLSVGQLFKRDARTEQLTIELLLIGYVIRLELEISFETLGLFSSYSLSFREKKCTNLSANVFMSATNIISLGEHLMWIQYKTNASYFFNNNNSNEPQVSFSTDNT